MNICLYDFETYSELDLKAVGAYEYSMHPSTDIICVGFQLGKLEDFLSGKPLEVHSWSPLLRDRNLKAYVLFENALRDPNTLLVAHNAFFDAMILRNVFTRRMPRPYPDFHWKRFRCTMAMCQAMALPRSLEDAAIALKLLEKKDKEGNRLVKKWCKPRKATKASGANRHLDLVHTMDTAYAELMRIIEYCKSDIRVTADILRRLPLLSEQEQRLWEITQTINARGFRVDRPLVQTILRLIAYEGKRLDAKLVKLTGGKVESGTKAAQLKQWICGQGFPISDMQQKTVTAALKAPETPPRIKAVLRIRQARSMSSTAKYERFEAISQVDGRARGGIVYHAASTGRWGGSLLNPQNFPRGTIRNSIQAAEIVAEGDPGLVRLIYGNPMAVYSSCLRTMIIPSEGNIFDVADYAQIEVRVLFWMAGHKAGLEVFKDKSRDIYKEAASGIFKMHVADIDKEGFERFTGKEQILGCLAEGTRVLTRQGYMPIEQIKTEEVWDGAQWVQHQGLLKRGVKSVIHIASLGIELTPNHWLFHQGMWQTAVEIASSGVTSHQKLEFDSGFGPLLVKRENTDPNALSLCAAYVELKDRLGLINCGLEKLLAAFGVDNLWPDKKAETSPSQLAIFFLMQGLEHVGKLVIQTLEKDAPIPMIKTSRGMAVAVLEYPSSPLENFWNTLLRWMGLISPASRWTELITIGVMSPETYELSACQLIAGTKEVYDLKNCGPNHCFQVESILAHNCGFGMGWKKFQQGMADKGRPITEELAKRVVDIYRRVNTPIVRMWYALEEAAIKATVSPGRKVHAARCIYESDGEFLYCTLPSGRRLAYHEPKVRLELKFGEKRHVLYHWTVDPRTKKRIYTSTYGGKLTENVVQATARDIMAEAKVRIEASGIWQLVLSVHDELISERSRFSEKTNDDYIALMKKLPKWAEGCPIEASGWSGERYRK